MDVETLLITCTSMLAVPYFRPDLPLAKFGDKQDLTIPPACFAMNRM